VGAGVSLGGFTAAGANVILGVDSAGFSAQMREAEGVFTRSTATMRGSLSLLQEKQVAAALAQQRYTAAVQRFGPASMQAQAALLRMSSAQRELASTSALSTSELKRLERGALAGSGALSGMGRAIAFASTAFLGGAGFVYALRSATEAAIGFQGSMTRIHTQAGATTGEVAKMGQALQRLAPQVGAGPKELADALFYIESRGYRGATALEALRVAAEGAKVGNADLRSVTDVLGASLKSGIKGVQDLNQAMGTINATVGAGAMTMQDLAGALSTGLLAQARGVGLSFRDVGAALAVMTDAGIPAEKAANRLGTTFNLIAHPTAVAQKQLASIGLTATQLGDTLARRGLVPALELLQRKLRESGLTATEQGNLLTRAFGGARMGGTVRLLLQQLANVERKVGDIGRAGGSFAADWAKEQQTAEFATARFHAALQALEVTIGTALLPTVTRAANGVADWMSKSENQRRIQQDLTAAIRDARAAGEALWQTFKALALVVTTVGDATGGTSHLIKTLVELLAAQKVIAFANALKQDLALGLDTAKAKLTETQTAVQGLSGSAVAAETELSPVVERINAYLGSVGAEAKTAEGQVSAAMDGIAASTAAAQTKVASDTAALDASFKGVGAAATTARETVGAELAGVGGAAAAAERKVGLLRGALLTLSRMGPLQLAIALSFVPGSSKGQKALDQAGVGFLGQLPFIGGALQQTARAGAAAGTAFDHAVGVLSPSEQKAVNAREFNRLAPVFLKASQGWPNPLAVFNQKLAAVGLPTVTAAQFAKLQAAQAAAAGAASSKAAAAAVAGGWMPPKSSPSSIYHGSSSGGGGGGGVAPGFSDVIPPALQLQLANAQYSGNKQAIRQALEAQLAWLGREYGLAHTPSQQLAIRQQQLSIKGQLESGATSSSSSTLKALTAALRPYLSRVAKAQQTTHTSADDRKALTAEQGFLKRYLSLHPGGAAGERANQLLAGVDKKLATLEKKASTPLSSLPALLKLENAVERAKQGGSTAREISALRAEQTFLRHYVERAGHGKQALAANKLLSSVDSTLKKLLLEAKKTSALTKAQLKQQEEAFLQTQAGFWATFGSDIFTQAGGVRSPGSQQRPTVVVNQSFPHPPTDDGQREAIYARNAMRAAFG
jgi:TP901 family phage tail tape measure protein